MKPKKKKAEDVGGLKDAQGPEKSKAKRWLLRNLAGAERG